MKSMSRLLLSLAAVAACATATAAPFDSADQARRDRNREEVMAKHNLGLEQHRRPPTAPRRRRRSSRRPSAPSSRPRTSVIAAPTGCAPSAPATNAKFKTQSTPAKNAYDHGPQ